MRIIQQYGQNGRPIPEMGKWGTMAVNMTEALEDALRQGEFSYSIPIGVLIDARSFFSPVELTLSSPESLYLPESEGVHRFEIIRYLLALQHAHICEEEIRDLTRRMCEFVKRLDIPQKLDKGSIDSETAKHLHDLFVEMGRTGGNEYYEKVMARSHEGMPNY